MSIVNSTITKVEESKEYWNISYDYYGFGLSKKYNIEPKIGDKIEIITKGFSVIRGIKINDTVVFYKTDEDLENENNEWRKKFLEQKEEEYKKEKSKLDQDYDSLPNVFKQRIDRFRANNPNFRRDYEKYEMFCIKEAIKIINHFSNGINLITKVNRNAVKKEIEDWYKKDYTEQKKEVNIDNDHSGNTFGMSVKLAWLYIDNPQNVIITHGSLSTLVGSEEFGDIKGRRNIRKIKLENIQKIC